MKTALRVIGIVFLLMQFIRPDRTNPPVDPELEVTSRLEVPSEVESLLRAACYDCHSNETAWPWYAHVAPTSWILTRHVDEGRRHLNLSEWALYPPSKADHKLDEIIEYVENREMPLPTYPPLHPEAKLSDEDRAAIIEWARTSRVALGVESED